LALAPGPFVGGHATNDAWPQLQLLARTCEDARFLRPPSDILTAAAGGSMAREITGKKVAILVTHGFEQIEMTEPRKALQDAGADTDLIAPEGGKVKAWNMKEWGQEFDVDVPLAQARADAYDALVLPGGVMNPDKMRMNEQALDFVRAFFDAGKPVAAI